MCFHNLKKEFGSLKYIEKNQLKDIALAVKSLTITYSREMLKAMI